MNAKPVIIFATLLLCAPPAFARLTDAALLMAAEECQAGDRLACENHYVSAGWDAGDLDVAVLVKKLSDACDAGDLRACTNWAATQIWAATQSLAGTLDDPRIYTNLSTACVSGDGWGCDLLGTMRIFAPFSPDGGYRALHDQRRDDCKRTNDPAACVDYAYLNETVGEVQPDAQARVGGLAAACAANEPRACTHLSFIYSDEVAVADVQKLQPDFALDYVRSAIAARKGCDLGNPIACWNLGIAYDFGEGVPEDWKTAQEFTAKACVLGMPSGCNEIAFEHYWKPGDPLDELTPACDAGDQSACLYVTDYKYTDNRNVADYRQSLRKICLDGGIQQACGYEAAMARKAGEFTAARRFARVACSLADGNGCVTLGNLYDLGEGIPADKAYATDLFGDACRLEEAVGCFNWGNMLAAGSGVPKDVLVAVDAYVEACEMRYEPACPRLVELLETEDGDAIEGYLQAICDAGSAKACDALSIWAQ